MYYVIALIVGVLVAALGNLFQCQEMMVLGCSLCLPMILRVWWWVTKD